LDADARALARDQDEACVARCKAGDVEAFSLLVERHQATVYNIAYRMVASSDEAQDLAQDAFVRAFAALRRFRGDCSFRTWICRIVTRLCVDALRAKPRRAQPLGSLQDSGAEGDWTESVVNRQVLEQAVASLPVHYRAAIVLRHGEGLSYEEIGRILHLPLGTVKTHIKRARTMLARHLGASFEGRKR
jgi:RNA polymerase sigma-70 factor (ECF subfamily)